MAGPTEPQSEWVARVLGFRGAPDVGKSAGSNAGGAVVRLAKGMILWNQTRGYVSQQLKLLQQAILSDAANEPDFDDISDNIGNLEEILEVLDDRLTDKLNELRGTIDLDEKRRLSDEARRIVQDYQSYVETDELMNDIDDNGFIQLDIRARVRTTLEAVMATI